MKTTIQIIRELDLDARPTDHNSGLFQDAEYLSEDTLRHQAWKDLAWRYEHHFVEIVVLTDNGCTIVFTSPGISGVESDSGKEYMSEVAQDQLDCLKQACDSLRLLSLTEAITVVR